MAGTRRSAAPSAHPLRVVGVVLAVVMVVLAVLVASCSGKTSGKPKAETTPTPTALPTATAAPTPPAHGCYLLSYADALKPTSSAEPVHCSGQHTDRTFYVGRLDNVVDGHLLAVDSMRVRNQMARECPQRFAAYVGGTAEQRRLSMLSVVWFGPTLEQSDKGQAWFRCDAISLATAGKLAPLGGKLERVLNSESGRTRWGRCATAKPGSKGAVHVLCSTNDAWRAVATVAVSAGPNGAWPGAKKASAAGARCEDLVRDRAKDPLKFTWGYEPPSEQQWKTGQHYGFCWAPRT